MAGAKPYSPSKLISLRVITTTPASVGFEDGCNSETAEVRVSGDALDIRLTGGTLVSCPHNVLGQNMHRVLAGHVGWSIAGRQLTLVKPAVGTLTLLDHRPYSDVTRLVNHAWHLNAYESTTGSRGSASYRTTTLRIQGSRYTLHHRCYVVAGHADYRRGLVTFDAGTHTKVAHCGTLPAPYAGSEIVRDARVDRIVAGSVIWSMDGQMLDITHGRETLVFSSV